MIKKLLLGTGLLLICLSCERDDNANIKLSEVILPEATQTGAMLFACKVDGMPFICRGINEVNGVYYSNNGGYTFGIRGSKKTDFTWGINLGNSGNAPISKGTYVLNGVTPGYWGSGSFVKKGFNYETSQTNAFYKGEMTITKFDLANEIVSGTFWFDIQNPWTGEKIEVREGRFDTHFSQ